VRDEEDRIKASKDVHHKGIMYTYSIYPYCRKHRLQHKVHTTVFISSRCNLQSDRYTSATYLDAFVGPRSNIQF